MTSLREWLNHHPLGAPYRGLRDILRISANRRELLEQNIQLRQALETNAQQFSKQLHAQAQYIDQLEQRHLARLNQLDIDTEHLRELVEPLCVTPDMPFSHTQLAAPWIINAEKCLGQNLADLPTDQRDHWFYSFYSEMAGGVSHVLEQQYRVYLPLLQKIPAGKVLDIGCGAGEFLNFLTHNGVTAMGIDLDAHEVERANERGLTAVHAEATEYFTRCEEKFAAISLLQVIEHVPPMLVRPLIEACANALVPGGMLLIETVNLRNPNAVNTFYTDPTHQVPLADNYMSFIFQWNGLESVEYIYTLPDWMAGISVNDHSRCYVNYAVIGYKSA